MGHVLISPLLDRPIRAMAQMSHYIKKTPFSKKGEITFSPQNKKVTSLPSFIHLLPLPVLYILLALTTSLPHKIRT
ncbi:hypothetical protein HanIR_Chr14g0672941 [Helianthus annuus]|nr:hypothetical protein HanIR_Chr14g0672941 [Helianthus annuus]